MATMTLKERVRRRCFHSLSYETAQAAGINLQQLQQICAYSYDLSDAQVEALARHFGIKEPA
jgi:hypothetical protein